MSGKNVTANSQTINLRPATEADLVAINDIYNHYVSHSTCTYQEEPESMEGRRQWFRHHGEKHPMVVAVADGKVVGWGSLSAYHVRSAYRRTVENSVYVHHEQHRLGIGSLLLQDLIQRARQRGHPHQIRIQESRSSEPDRIQVQPLAGCNLYGVDARYG